MNTITIVVRKYCETSLVVVEDTDGKKENFEVTCATNHVTREVKKEIKRKTLNMRSEKGNQEEDSCFI